MITLRVITFELERKDSLPLAVGSQAAVDAAVPLFGEILTLQHSAKSNQ